MDPLEWGWRNHEGRLVPIKTDLHADLKNSCRSFGVPAKLDVSQKDTVIKHGILCTTAARNAKVFDVKIDSILIQVIIIQCFRKLSIIF